MRKFVGIEVYEWVKGDNKTNLDDRKKNKERYFEGREETDFKIQNGLEELG